MTEASAATTLALLRQLSIGLSAYRMFPGNLEQPAFAAAADRIRQAAQVALQAGPVEIEVRGEGFATEAGPLPGDETIDRLARVCYERRAEWLRVRSVPERAELAGIYEVLAMPSEEVVAAGGVAALCRRGVASIVLGEVSPQAVESSSMVAHRMRTAGLESMEWMSGSIAIPTDELGDGAALREMADSLFSRFQAVVASLPPEMADSVDLYRMLHDAVANLPEEQRRALNTVLIDQSRLDPLAERYVGTMSDTELARVLADLSGVEGADPRLLAEAVVRAGGRDRDLVTLTAAIAAGGEDAGTILPGDDEQFEAEPSVFETVSDLLGRSLLSREQRDLEAIRGEFPEEEADQRKLTARSVSDYLRAEPDLERLERVLSSWMGQARAALRERDPGDLALLLSAAEGPRAEVAVSDRERAVLFDVYRRQIPEPALVGDLVFASEEPDQQAASRDLLAPLGPAAVDSLMQVLGTAKDGAHRARALNVAAGLAPAHIDRVASRLSDPDWRVVRDTVAVLHRAGGPEVAPLMDQASRHPEPAVRQEAVWGLIGVGGDRAAPRLRELAEDPEESVRTLAVGALGGLVSKVAVAALSRIVCRAQDPAVRRLALEHLGRHPSPDATAALADLAGRRTTPRASRALRRRARVLSRERDER